MAIDDRRLVTAAELRQQIEEDYWYGPRLTAAWLDDPYGVGRTVHEFPEDSAELLLGYHKFFAYWRMNTDAEKIVQMEELVETSRDKIAGYCLLRYLHSIRDIRTQEFIHVDGAVRAYDDGAFALRSQETMPTSTDANDYRKVWRIDGSISTDEWSGLAARWFRGNRLATEYLEHFVEPEA
jgi:hypothetical protein